MGGILTKKIITAIAVLLLMAAGFGAWKLFVIGTPDSSTSFAVQVEEGDGQLTIYIRSTDSGKAISNLQYNYQGTALHLTVWTVLSSPLNDDGENCLYYELADETELWVGDHLVWTKE